jgi:hypothetical protein
MRPERFRYEMNLAFDEWFKSQSISKFKPLLREMERVWNKRAKEEDDYRSGEEVYGYETTESIHNNMMYISDRWRCAFRLRWLLDGIKSGKIC